MCNNHTRPRGATRINQRYGKSANKTIEVVGISTKRGAAMYESIKQGRPVITEEKATLADSLLGGIGLYNRFTFDLVKQHVDEIILVNEAEIAAGMIFMLNQHRMIIEGAAASGIGAALHKKTA